MWTLFRYSAMSKGAYIYSIVMVGPGVVYMYVTTGWTGGRRLLEVTWGYEINPSPPLFSQSSGGGGDISVGASSLSLSLPDRWELLAQIWRPTLLPAEPLPLSLYRSQQPPPGPLFAAKTPFSVVTQPQSPAAAAAMPVCIPNTDRPGLSQFWKIINITVWLIADACRSIALLIKAALYFPPTLVMCASAMSVWSQIG